MVIKKKKVKKIKMSNFLNMQTAYQIGAMWEALGYKVKYITFNNT